MFQRLVMAVVLGALALGVCGTASADDDAAAKKKKKAAPGMAAEFKKLDKDGDGKLTQEEF
ncbi:MAG TPA: EF-hand domain-containing protein, partial [Gemmataceae bacterium]|nr:EF-hand domain-containing protein [Gemmataceae bacterium]